MIMSLPTLPEWLKVRDGVLQFGINEQILFVILDGQPQYRLNVRPASGQFVCNVTQTVNGKQVGDDTKYSSIDAAIAGGLESLRKHLGW